MAVRFSRRVSTFLTSLHFLLHLQSALFYLPPHLFLFTFFSVTFSVPSNSHVLITLPEPILLSYVFPGLFSTFSLSAGEHNLLKPYFHLKRVL